jgi:membrane-associated PAP2 superfamily phosphatase
MKKTDMLWQSLLCILGMIGIVWMESFTDIDMLLQKLWFDQSSYQWLITQEMHGKWRWLFYGGMKKGVAIFGTLSVFAVLYGAYTKKQIWIRGGTLMILSLLITPLAVNGLKAITNIYCPYELVDFGGQAIYQRILTMADPANAGLICGRCFPAGHASGGFALTMIFFCIPLKKWRLAALTGALGYGWIMGIYQMLRGDHFLSHTLMTMLLAWQINILLVWCADSFMRLEIWRILLSKVKKG